MEDQLPVTVFRVRRVRKGMVYSYNLALLKQWHSSSIIKIQVIHLIVNLSLLTVPFIAYPSSVYTLSHIIKEFQ